MPAMFAPDAYTLTATLAVCTYYAAAWTVVVRGPKAGTIVPLYEPPDHLSPAAVRYAWRRTFDDRTFWAAVLSIVSKGLATIKSEDGATVLHITPVANLHALLPQEERLLVGKMLDHRTSKGMRIDMLDGRFGAIVSQMADILRRQALGVWLRENRKFLATGQVLSLIAVVVAARPRWRDEWFALALSLAIIAPSAYYLPFLLFRLHDLYRTAHDKLDSAVIRRAALLSAWIFPCISGITLGLVELGGTFGWPVVAVATVMAVLDVSFLHFMRTPTQDGRKLLDQVEGFRLFLKEVEQLPMNQSEAPHEHAGVYEKFLPYAVALEVEQAWCNRFLAMASSFNQPDSIPNTQSLYLGMWDGKPVDIVFGPQPGRRA
jgi:hypothetical protein